MSATDHAAFIAALDSSRPDSDAVTTTTQRLITRQTVSYATIRTQVGSLGASNALTMTRRPARGGLDGGTIVLVGLDMTAGPLPVHDVLEAAGIPAGTARDLITGQPARLLNAANFPNRPWEVRPVLERWMAQNVPSVVLLVRTDQGPSGAATKVAERAVPLPMRSVVSVLGVSEAVAAEINAFLAEHDIAPLRVESICVLQRTSSELTDQFRLTDVSDAAATRRLAANVEAGLKASAHDLQEFLTTATADVLADESLLEDDSATALQAQADQTRAHSTRINAQLTKARAELSQSRRRTRELEHELDALRTSLEPDETELPPEAKNDPAPIAQPDEPAASAEPDPVFESFPDLISAARQQFKLLVLSDDLDTPAAALDKHTKAAVWRARAWCSLLMLQGYADYRAGGATGAFRMWLENHPRPRISPHNVATGETALTAADLEFRRARTFAVPLSVAGDGFSYFGAHIRIEPGRTSPAPRLHYLDDCAGTGKIYIGHLGRHLPSHRGE